MFTPKWDTLKPSENSSSSSPQTTPNLPEPPAGQPGLVPSPNNAIEAHRSLEALLNEPYLAVSRRIELANLLVGFEQANHYTLYNRHGQIVGYLAEDNSIAKTFIRNIARTHRPFSAAVFDPQGNILLRIQRPFYWITSSLFVHTPAHEPVGEIHTNWHLWRRRYSLYSDRAQFARIDAPLLSWEFTLLDEDGRILVRGGGGGRRRPRAAPATVIGLASRAQSRTRCVSRRTRPQPPHPPPPIALNTLHVSSSDIC